MTLRWIALVATALAPLVAEAQLFRAYAASDGSDANPCTLAQPCRLLPAALSAVADGGEIWMLDSANYNTGPVTINKGVSIIAIPGAFGSVVALGGAAMVVTANDKSIALRNLTIVPFPTSGATHGVDITGPSRVTIENSLIANLSLGVRVSGTGAKVEIANTTIRGNSVGVDVRNGAIAVISTSRLIENTGGGIIVVSDTPLATWANIVDSTISGKGIGDGSVGIEVFTSNANGTARASVTRCAIQGMSSALVSGSGAGSASIGLSYSMVTNNLDAWVLNGAGAEILSFGNNHFVHNASSVGSLTPAVLQ